MLLRPKQQEEVLSAEAVKDGVVVSLEFDLHNWISDTSMGEIYGDRVKDVFVEVQWAWHLLPTIMNSYIY